MRETLTALLAGTIFGAGLAISQMTNPAKVQGFLDVAGSWDPSLAFVMGSALIVSAIGYRLHVRRTGSGTPQGQIDVRLLGGATLFGIGWGLAGFCPGPAIAALVTGSAQVALFVVSMIAGMGLFRLTAQRRSLIPLKETPR